MVVARISAIAGLVRMYNIQATVDVSVLSALVLDTLLLGKHSGGTSPGITPEACLEEIVTRCVPGTS